MYARDAGLANANTIDIVAEHGGFAYADYDRGDDSGAILGAGIRLYVAPQISVAADFRRSFVGDLDTDSIGISGRVQF